MILPQKKLYTEDDYYSIPEDVRAELIYGQIYYQAAPSRKHQDILMSLSSVVHQYIKSKGGSCKVYPAPFAVKLYEDDKTIVEPDISVICGPGKLTDRGCTGAPDWIIEIVSPGNPGQDYIKKLNLYQETGVREYWIINPMTEKVLVYYYEGSILAEQYTFQDTVKVNIYEDFTIDFKSLGI